MRFWIIIAVSLFCLGISGCMTETVTVKELDKQGNVVKITTTKSSDVVDKIMSEMKNKDVMWYANGWRAYIVATFTDSETYMPNIKLKAEKIDSGHLSLRPAMPASDIIKIYKEMGAKMTPVEFAAIIKAVNPEFKLSDAADIIKAMKTKLGAGAGKDGVELTEK